MYGRVQLCCFGVFQLVLLSAGEIPAGFGVYHRDLTGFSSISFRLVSVVFWPTGRFQPVQTFFDQFCYVSSGVVIFWPDQCFFFFWLVW